MKLTQEQFNQVKHLEISEYELSIQYMDMLNDCYPAVEICGYKYDAGEALKAVDPIAFSCGEGDYLSSRLEDELVELSYPQDEAQYPYATGYFNREDVESKLNIEL